MGSERLGTEFLDVIKRPGDEDVLRKDNLKRNDTCTTFREE